MYSTIQEIVASGAERFGNDVGFRYKLKKQEIGEKTYTQLKEDSESFSCALESMGHIGQHIAIVGATSYEWVVAYLGIVNSGSVAVPLDASLPAFDLWELMDRADATVLLFDEAHRAVAEDAKSHCPKLQNLIALQPMESADFALDLHTLLEKHRGAWQKPVEPEDLCTILFTSGTTGKSKGVMLSHRNLAANVSNIQNGIPERIVLLTVLPIHHAYCLSLDILKGISLGAVICINDSLLRVAKNIQLFQPEIILMVPLMVETLAKKLEDTSLLPAKIVKNKVFGKQFKTICCGGAFLDPQYIDFFQKYDITILQGYGMTECSPVISTMPRWDIRKETVGKHLDNCEVKTVDNELWVKGSSVMMGYYRMPEETAAVLEDGWLKTGDLGYVDGDGYLYLTGRKKNLIITKNGENVSPEELENDLSTHRLVQEVLVREGNGVIEAHIFPDYEYAKKKRIKDIPAALQQIIDTYNAGAPAYKRIYALVVRETEFDKTPSKKIKRF